METNLEKLEVMLLFFRIEIFTPPYTKHPFTEDNLKPRNKLLIVT